MDEELAARCGNHSLGGGTIGWRSLGPGIPDSHASREETVETVSVLQVSVRICQLHAWRV